MYMNLAISCLLTLALYSKTLSGALRFVSDKPISLQDMKIARRSTPARPLPESVFCPEPGTWANYWKPEPDIDAVVDCTSFDDTLCKCYFHFKRRQRSNAKFVSNLVQAYKNSHSEGYWHP